MKKILFSLLIGFCIFGSLLFTSSCTKQYLSPVTIVDTAFNKTLLTNQIATSQWTTADTGKTYTTTVTPPTGSSFDLNGGLLIYFSFDGGNTYEQIPEVYANYSFSYTYTSGVIKLYAQSATGADLITAPDPLTVKIILVASN